jgi:hypothetical protein
LVAGGFAISSGKLRAFRRQNAALLTEVNLQVLKTATSQGFVKPMELATDSVRLRAHASTKAARTLKRSRARLEELGRVDVGTLDEPGRARHAAKVSKHTESVTVCEKSGRTNFIVTSPSAGLLKFPTGATGPGHRVTMTAAGVRERFVVDCLIDADGHDFGKLAGAMTRTRTTLESLGVNVEKMQVAADAGYWSDEDLRFAAENCDWVDVLVAERQMARRGHRCLPSGRRHAGPVQGWHRCPLRRSRLWHLPFEGPLYDGTAQVPHRQS